jgi:hypothetical protein
MANKKTAVGSKTVRVVSASEARRLLMHGSCLAEPGPTDPATPRSVAAMVERMGFVQVDTISTVERAHHLILASRLPGYRPAMLSGALERNARLFEHWTHDASIIPLKWYPHWRHRFERTKSSGKWHRHQLGKDAERLMAAVLDRISREGPLSSRDFEQTGETQRNSWWGWKPSKVALDYLWRAGVLHIAGRRNFHKVYDLTERVIPKHAARPQSTEAEHIDWACRTALERLGTATIREISHFWAAIKPTQVKGWIDIAKSSSEVIEVSVESADSSPQIAAFALSDLDVRLVRAPKPPAGIRLLCPFDPVLRDRARAKRLFNFDFRFEGFVPASKRVHGYYVMAILDGERFIGKADPKFDRAAGTLRIAKHWWEPGVNPTRAQQSRFQAGAERLASWIGARDVEISR